MGFLKNFVYYDRNYSFMIFYAYYILYLYLLSIGFLLNILLFLIIATIFGIHHKTIFEVKNEASFFDFYECEFSHSCFVSLRQPYHFPSSNISSNSAMMLLDTKKPLGVRKILSPSWHISPYAQ